MSQCEYSILNHLVRGNNYLDFNMIHFSFGIHKVAFYIFILHYRWCFQAVSKNRKRFFITRILLHQNKKTNCTALRRGCQAVGYSHFYYLPIFPVSTQHENERACGDALILLNSSMPLLGQMSKSMLSLSISGMIGHPGSVWLLPPKLRLTRASLMLQPDIYTCFHWLFLW